MKVYQLLERLAKAFVHREQIHLAPLCDFLVSRFSQSLEPFVAIVAFDHGSCFIINSSACTVNTFLNWCLYLTSNRNSPLLCTRKMRQVAPFSKQHSKCCLMSPLSNRQSAGSQPCTSSVAYAIAYSPQSQAFGWAWTLTKSKCTLSAFGLITEQIAFFIAKLIVVGTPLS